MVDEREWCLLGFCVLGVLLFLLLVMHRREDSVGSELSLGLKGG
jgi:hypothetical protein